jgi:CRP/FNR family transcriptional regulator, cyclic AMP receptor protein
LPEASEIGLLLNMRRYSRQALTRFFRSAPVFGGLEGRSLERVISALQEREFPAGSTIFNAGELGRTMYLLAEGQVDVICSTNEGKQISLAQLGPGECFGEMALVELQPRSATVRVRKRAKTFSLNNMDLWNLYREDNYAYVIVLQNICRILSRRLRKADSRISEYMAATRRGSSRKFKVES